MKSLLGVIIAMALTGCVTIPDATDRTIPTTDPNKTVTLQMTSKPIRAQGKDVYIGYKLYLDGVVVGNTGPASNLSTTQGAAGDNIKTLTMFVAPGTYELYGSGALKLSIWTNRISKSVVFLPDTTYTIFCGEKIVFIGVAFVTKTNCDVQ